MIFSPFLSLLWILAALYWIDISDGLKAIPVRTNITYFNTKYMKDSSFTITRFGRKSPYYFNVYANILSEWNNNVTIQLVFNEFLHNEYKRSFLEFKHKFCDFLTGSKYIGTAIRGAGMSCPLKPKLYVLENITFPTENFPNVFPYKQGRVDVTISRSQDLTFILSGYIELHFETNKKKSAT